jgi:sulfite exporter TauE/SafE
VHAHLPASGDLVLLFFASALGSAHCVGMCGPYVALCAARLAPGRTTAGTRLAARLLFNGGRLATYAAIGALVGAFGQIALAAGARAHLGGALAIAAGMAAVLFGVGLAGWIRDPAGIAGKLGLDALIRGSARGAFRARPYASGILLGAVQGALPCALVYGAASRAAVAGSASAGAGVMLVFGLGTVPAIFALASVPSGMIRRLHGRRWSGLLVGAVGALLILRGAAALGWIARSPFW